MQTRPQLHTHRISRIATSTALAESESNEPSPRSIREPLHESKTARTAASSLCRSGSSSPLCALAIGLFPSFSPRRAKIDAYSCPPARPPAPLVLCRCCTTRERAHRASFLALVQRVPLSLCLFLFLDTSRAASERERERLTHVRARGAAAERSAMRARR